MATEPIVAAATPASGSRTTGWLAVAGRLLIADMVLWLAAGTWLVFAYSGASDGSDTGAAADLVAGVSVLLWLFAAGLGSLGAIVGFAMIANRLWAPVAATWLGGAYAALVVGVVLAAELKWTPPVIVVLTSQLVVLFGAAVVGTAVAAERYDASPPITDDQPSEPVPTGPPLR